MLLVRPQNREAPSRSRVSESPKGTARPLLLAILCTRMGEVLVAKLACQKRAQLHLPSQIAMANKRLPRGWMMVWQSAWEATNKEHLRCAGPANQPIFALQTA